MPKRTTFVPVLFVSDPPELRNQAARDREAREYWDSLTPQQEGWVARKMGFHQLGKAPIDPIAGFNRTG